MDEGLHPVEAAGSRPCCHDGPIVQARATGSLHERRYVLGTTVRESVGRGMMWNWLFGLPHHVSIRRVDASLIFQLM